MTRPAAQEEAPPATAAVTAAPRYPACPAFNTVHSERMDYPALGLTLDAAPFYVHVGDPVTVTLALRNDGDRPLEGVVVSMTVPAGLAEVHCSQGDYDPPSGRRTLPLPRLEVNQALTVTLRAQVAGPALPDGHAILWVEASGGTLPVPARAGALAKLWKPGDTEAQPTVLHTYDFDTLDQFPVLWTVWRKGDANADPWMVGGTWERRFYDGLGRQVETQTPDYDWNGAGGGHELVAYTQYDGLGQVTAASVPYQRTPYQAAMCGAKVCTPYLAPDLNQPRTRTAYDPLGRTVAVTNTDGTVVRTTYDQWVTTVYDEQNHQVEREMDELGRLLQVREYLGTAAPYTWYASTGYGYNVRDQLTDVWDEAGNHTQLTYDRLGQQTALSDPDLGSWSYVCDPRGNRTQQTDAKGQVLNFTYDSLSRVTYQDLPGGTANDVTFQYDNTLGDAVTANSWGKLRRAYVGSSTTANAHEYKYDTRGRTNWERVRLDGTSYDTLSSFDSLDRLLTLTYSDGEVVTHDYRPNGQLNSVVGTSVYVGGITYTPWGAPDVMQLGASGTPLVQVDYNYYSWTGGNGEGQARLARIMAGVAADRDSLQDLNYSYDLAGNVTTIVDNKAGGVQTQSFTYDDLDRILSAGPAGASGGSTARRTPTAGRAASWGT